MTRYRCKVVSPKGGVLFIEREAATEKDVVAAMRMEGFAILEIRKAWSIPNVFKFCLKRIRSIDIELGMRQMGAMLSSGVSVLMALDTIVIQANNSRVARLWRDVSDAIRSGSSFTEALSKHSRFFSEDIIQLINAGEKSGELDEAFKRVADYLETKRSLKTLVTNALVYPSFATIMAIGVSVYLVMVVIPKIAEFLEGGNVALPMVTQMLMDVSGWLHQNFVYVAGAILSMCALWIVLRRFKFGRKVEDLLLMKLPIIGGVIRLSSTIAFSKGMSQLIESGITIVDSLETCAKMMNNRMFRDRVKIVADKVSQGLSLSDSISEGKEFNPMLSRMIAVAETTGTLGTTFEEVARFHETLLSILIKRLSVFIEPLMILVTTAIVGFVYVAFFMAIFAMAQVG